ATAGWNVSGLIEMDFAGSRPVDNTPSTQAENRFFHQPRLRRGYVPLDHCDWRIVAGQDKAILAPLDPISLSHVATPLGATAGNLWGWLPQGRIDMNHKLGNASALFQFGVLRPQFADPRLGDVPGIGTSIDGAPGLGERATHPFYQSRVAVSHPMNGSSVTV